MYTFNKYVLSCFDGIKTNQTCVLLNICYYCQYKKKLHVKNHSISLLTKLVSHKYCFYPLDARII